LNLELEKNQIYTIGAAILAVLVIAGGLLLYERNSKEIINYKEPNLSQEDREKAEHRLSEAIAALEQVNQDVGVEDIFNKHMDVGRAYYILGHYKEAEENFKKALEYLPVHGGAWSTLAELQTDMGKYEDARTSINKAIETDPSDADYWKRYLILAEEKLNISPAGMDNFYNEAFFKTNFHIDIITAYASYQEKKGNYVSAINYLKIAKEKNPDNAAAYDAEIDRLQELVNQQNNLQ
jgi:tetratricopeptide (TPR) repeat protein